MAPAVGKIRYTRGMRIIAAKWKHLVDGHRAVRELAGKLGQEFGTSLQEEQSRLHQGKVETWRRSRRVFFALLAVAVLALVTLCVMTFFFQEAACVIIYWVLLVVIILVTLGVAGRNYVKAMLGGAPTVQSSADPGVDLEEGWWQGLQPEEAAGSRKKGDLVDTLARSLADEFLAVPFSENEFLLVGPAGTWLLREEGTSGLIARQDGRWKNKPAWLPWRRRQARGWQEIVPPPDEAWLERAKEVNTRLSGLDRTVQGGVAFSHPQVRLHRKRIIGNTAAYGRPKGWVQRILSAPAMEGFTVEQGLGLLETAAGERDGAVSAVELAGELYEQGRVSLQAELVKKAEPELDRGGTSR
jgi:hypothetical protein